MRSRMRRRIDRGVLPSSLRASACGDPSALAPAFRFRQRTSRRPQPVPERRASGNAGNPYVMQISSVAEQQGEVPEDFVVFRNAGAFAEKNGPLYLRESDSTLGFRVSPAHSNPIGVCHGGWLGTFLDMQMSLKAIREGGLE